MYIYIWAAKFSPDIHHRNIISSAEFFRGTSAELPRFFRAAEKQTIHQDSWIHE